MKRRALWVLFLLLVPATDAIAGETRTRRSPAAADDELVLPSAAVSAAVEPWVPDVRACWLRFASRRARADGNLRIELIIDPTGMVWRHRAVFAGPRSRGLERCLAGVVDQWRFPMRRGHTHAAVPFLLRASAAPGAGPRRSCWSPRGCRHPARRP